MVLVNTTAGRCLFLATARTRRRLHGGRTGGQAAHHKRGDCAAAQEITTAQSLVFHDLLLKQTL
jgi:hypothetical protein